MRAFYLRKGRWCFTATYNVFLTPHVLFLCFSNPLCWCHLLPIMILQQWGNIISIQVFTLLSSYHLTWAVTIEKVALSTEAFRREKYRCKNALEKNCLCNHAWEYATASVMPAAHSDLSVLRQCVLLGAYISNQKAVIAELCLRVKHYFSIRTNQ